MSLYVTLLIVPVSSSLALMRIPRTQALVLKFSQFQWRLFYRTVDRVFNCRSLEGDSLNGVVRSSTDRSDGKTVATRANTVLESDILVKTLAPELAIRFRIILSTYGTRVDCNTVVLVVDSGTGDDHIAARTNIEAVGVVTASGVTSLVVDGHISDSQSITSVDADGLNGSVLNIEIGNGGRAEVVGVEELGLRHTTVTSLPIPPAGSIGVQLGATGTLDVDSSALDLEERTVPFLVSPSCLALEDNLSSCS